jgi:hypothetical protein
VEGHRAVLLARGVDHHLGLGRLLGLDLNLVGRDLGLRQRVDQALVVEDVAGALREQLEDGALDVLELGRHLGVGDDQLIFELLQVGPLLGDRDAQQLVLQPLLRDGKVEERHLIPARHHAREHGIGRCQKIQDGKHTMAAAGARQGEGGGVGRVRRAL